MSDDPSFAALEDVGIAERDKPPFVRLPKPENLFGLRAMRFAALAPGHQLEAYLLFLSALSKVQDRLTRELPASALPTLAEMRQRAGHAMPILPREELADDPAASEAFSRLVTLLTDIAMPDLARAALERAGKADDEGRRAMFAAVLADAVPVEAVAEHIFAAAALQIVAAQHAAQLAPVLPQPVADGVCPCCGGPPVSSAVVGDANIEGVRYVQCSLCATQWNHVRVKCVSCGSTKGIAYQAIEGIADTIKAETCDECRTYVKILNQRKDMELEPVADDVASLGLDLLVTKAGWRRAGVNPFLLGY
ncbi:formate dehydrogenase accessory protein FdhE [Bosea sp. F3-2]|uniref:formate dehydrogenase accessory protein FdhE n=1 Tax=Bosea sp. F3-2 TaxID=2599640 RepID=UPI0011EEC1F8|nr:formate dehydrogenase accessory protein FdhE [Bosea sp. F3-2]QEL22749.1 formate dehydrogenase accessory protein FdhE [Bosea sp. F3-2]